MAVNFFFAICLPCVKSIIHGIELSFSHLTNALQKTAIIDDEIIKHEIVLNHTEGENTSPFYRFSIRARS